MPRNTNYTLGRGALYFQKTGDRDWYWFGNTPEFTATSDSEELEHFSSESGIREKDDSVILEVSRTATIVCDDISVQNLALFFLGSSSTVTTAPAVGLSEDLTVDPGAFIQIGETAANIAGARGLANVVVESNPAGTTYLLGADYTVNLATGLLEILTGGAIAAASDITITYDIVGGTSDLVVSGGAASEGALRFISDNPKGDQRDAFMRSVRISPNGDLSFKGDEWQQIPLSVEILKVEPYEAIELYTR